MARIRSVHPGLFTDAEFAGCSPAAQILLIGIWTEADDHGAFEWKPVTLKMRIMPVHHVDVPELMAELEAANIIRRYEHGGRHLGLVRNFCRYQRPKKPKYVHFIPPEFRTYVASEASGTEPEEDEAPQSTEPRPPDEATVPKKVEPEVSEDVPIPKKGELGPQREEEGGRGGGRSKQGSESNDSGENALPSDLGKALWDIGVRLLVETGKPNDEARKIIGRWRGALKDDDRLLALLSSAIANKIVDPISYVSKAIAARKNGKADKEYGEFGRPWL